jgi:hypothetical protein
MKAKKQKPAEGTKQKTVPAKSLSEIKVIQNDQDNKLDKFPPEVLAKALRKVLEDDE